MQNVKSKAHRSDQCGAFTKAYSPTPNTRLRRPVVLQFNANDTASKRLFDPPTKEELRAMYPEPGGRR